MFGQEDGQVGSIAVSVLEKEVCEGSDLSGKTRHVHFVSGNRRERTCGEKLCSNFVYICDLHIFLCGTVFVLKSK